MKNAQVEIIQLDQLLVELLVGILEQAAHLQGCSMVEIVVVIHGQDQIQGELVVTLGQVQTLEQVEELVVVVFGQEPTLVELVVVILGPVETQELVEHPQE